MPREHDDELRFHPTSGRGTGVIAVVAALAVVVLTVVNPGEAPRWVAPGAALLGVLAWASILRPRLSIEGDDLVLHNMLETVRVPLAAVEAVVVRQFLAVWAGGRRYVSPALGKSWRTSLRRESGLPTVSRMGGANPLGRISRATGSSTPDVPAGGIEYVDYVEEAINQRVKLARLGAEDSDATVRREPAWLPVGLIAASALALLVSVLV